MGGVNVDQNGQNRDYILTKGPSGRIRSTDRLLDRVAAMIETLVMLVLHLPHDRHHRPDRGLLGNHSPESSVRGSLRTHPAALGMIVVMTVTVTVIVPLMSPVPASSR